VVTFFDPNEHLQGGVQSTHPTHPYHADDRKSDFDGDHMVTNMAATQAMAV
jgi:hypothetical protein